MPSGVNAAQSSDNLKRNVLLCREFHQGHKLIFIPLDCFSAECFSHFPLLITWTCLARLSESRMKTQWQVFRMDFHETVACYTIMCINSSSSTSCSRVNCSTSWLPLNYSQTALHLPDSIATMLPILVHQLMKGFQTFYFYHITS